MPSAPHIALKGSLFQLPEGSRILVELPGPKPSLAKLFGRIFIEGAALGEDLMEQERRSQRSEDHEIHPARGENLLEVEDEPELVGPRSDGKLDSQVHIALRPGPVEGPRPEKDQGPDLLPPS
jgi:hypothetical protein